MKAVFEEKKPNELKADVRMISGCEGKFIPWKKTGRYDIYIYNRTRVVHNFLRSFSLKKNLDAQTSADVSNVSAFCLPDPAVGYLSSLEFLFLPFTYYDGFGY